MDSDFEEMVRVNLFRPRRFMCAWGVHLGGYAGGALGTAIAAVRVLYLRKIQAPHGDGGPESSTVPS
jgi:hypothetical protein